MKRKTTALVLSGGANRGALHVGALQALFERGLAVDMLVGVSAGALNAAFLAPDPGLTQVERLAAVWRRTTKEDVYPGNRAAMLWRALRGEPNLFPNGNFHRHLLANAPHGLQRFGDLARTRLSVVAAHRASSALRLFGDDPSEPIVEALMASSAIPPLLPPWCLEDECLIDGALATPLPVCVALARGATDLWAIQVVADSAARLAPEDLFGVSARAVSVMLARHVEDEIALLRRAGGRLITVRGYEHLLPWDYTHTEEMIAEGYRQAREQLARLPLERPSVWQGVRTAVEGLARRARNGRRSSQPVKLASPKGSPVWLFDLDNTLYPSSAGLMEAMNARIDEFLGQRLNLPPALAQAVRKVYYGRYGSSVGGVLRHCQVDAGDFLDFIHDLPIEQYLSPDRRLEELLNALPGHKYIFTNAAADYARRALRALGVEHHFDGIFDIHFGGLEGKPAPGFYRKVLAALGHPAGACWFVEDSAPNLSPAKALGCRTVWLTADGVRPPAHVEYVIHDLARLREIGCDPAQEGKLTHEAPKSS